MFNPNNVTNNRFPSAIDVQNQLKHDRNTYRYGDQDHRTQELHQLTDILSHKLTVDSSALESLNWQYAYRRFLFLTGVAESFSFSATIPYDADLLNGALAQGKWNVHVDQFTRTMEVSTENLYPADDSGICND